MSAKHTPGPWFCGRALRGGQECIIGDGDSVVAFMPDRTIGCTFIPEDARLIAAAPIQHAELLACKQFLEDMHTQSAEWTVAESQKRHIAVCAAIAAATGEKA